MNRSLAILTTLAISLTLAACSNSEASESTLTVSTVMATSLDPADATRVAATLNATWPVYDRLLNVSESGEYMPMLATKWTFSPDGKTLTLQLRTGVTFSDGTAFDAEAVKANVERYQSAPASKASTAMIASVEVVDAHTVALHLTAPTRAVLNALAVPAPGSMISPKALHNEDLDSHPVGTGAWVLDSYRPGQEIVYKRRTDKGGIWDPKTGKISRIDLKSQAADASNNAIKTGQADIVPFYGNKSAVSDVLTSGAVTLRATPTAMSMIAIFMNSAKKPFDDVRVRQAVNLAIDRKGIVDSFEPTTVPRVQPFPDVVNGFDPKLEDTYPNDQAKAKQLLVAAGHPDGVDAGTFLVANIGQVPSIAQALQSQLAQAGIKIRLQNYDVGQLVTDYPKSNATGSITYLAYPSIEPGADLAWLYQNPLYLPGGGVPASITDKIAAVDDSTVSAQVRADRVREISAYAVKNALYAPIQQGIPGFLVAKRVHGLEQDQELLAPYGAQDFRYLTLK